jgi:lincosamide nucleotidyltransferase A/C/D/E
VISAAEVLAVLDLLAIDAIDVWLDGGWGVDALLGEQTRPHDDLDLVIDATRVADARRLLEDAGFVAARDWLPAALALRHADGRAVDLHPVALAADGGGEQTLLDGALFHYDPPAQGIVGGRALHSVSAATQLLCHLGYQPDADDRADMQRLACRFGLALPPPYS